MDKVRRYIAETVAGYAWRLAVNILHPPLGCDREWMIGELAARTEQLEVRGPSERLPKLFGLFPSEFVNPERSSNQYVNVLTEHAQGASGGMW